MKRISNWNQVFMTLVSTIQMTEEWTNLVILRYAVGVTPSRALELWVTTTRTEEWITVKNKTLSATYEYIIITEHFFIYATDLYNLRPCHEL